MSDFASISCVDRCDRDGIGNHCARVKFDERKEGTNPIERMVIPFQ